MCKYCDAIRQHAGLIVTLSLGSMSTRDALHCLATMYALSKRDAKWRNDKWLTRLSTLRQRRL